MPKLGEVSASRQNLVDVGLVPGVPDHRVARRLEHPMERNRELDDSEVWSQVATGLGHFVDQKLANLLSQLGQLFGIEAPQVGG